MPIGRGIEPANPRAEMLRVPDPSAREREIPWPASSLHGPLPDEPMSGRIELSNSAVVWSGEPQLAAVIERYENRLVTTSIRQSVEHDRV